MKKKQQISLIAFSAFAILSPGLSLAASACPHTGAHFTSVFGTDTYCYQEWIQQVWPWAIGIAVSLSVVMVSFAGILWMTSAGDPDKITTARKMIMGVLSGLALLVLARVFLSFLGLGSLWIF